MTKTVARAMVAAVAIGAAFPVVAEIDPNLPQCDTEVARIYGTAGGSGVVGGGEVEVMWELSVDQGADLLTVVRRADDCDSAACMITVPRLRLPARVVAASSGHAVVVTDEVRDTMPPGNWSYRLVVAQPVGGDCYVDSEPIEVVAPTFCGAFNVCSQVSDSFTVRAAEAPDGPTSEATVRWQTTAEDESVAGYRLTRAPGACNDRSCREMVAWVGAGSTCGITHFAELAADSSDGVWVWRLEVMDHDRQPLCHVDVMP